MVAAAVEAAAIKSTVPGVGILHPPVAAEAADNMADPVAVARPAEAGVMAQKAQTQQGSNWILQGQETAATLDQAGHLVAAIRILRELAAVVAAAVDTAEMAVADQVLMVSMGQVFTAVPVVVAVDMAGTVALALLPVTAVPVVVAVDTAGTVAQAVAFQTELFVAVAAADMENPVMAAQMVAQAASQPEGQPQVKNLAAITARGQREETASASSHT